MSDASDRTRDEAFVVAVVSRLLRGERVAGQRLEAINVSAGETALLERGSVQEGIARLSERFGEEADGLTTGPTEQEIADDYMLVAGNRWVPQPFGGAPAPGDGDYILQAANAALPNGRVLTDTSEVEWDFTTPSQAKANLAAGVVYGVSSVFGRVGAVVAVALDYVASFIGNDSGVAGATVKAALDTLAGIIAGHMAVDAVTGHGTVGAHNHLTNPAGGRLALGALQDGTALSLVGRSANSTGVYADIAGTTTGHVPRIDSGALTFGTLDTPSFAANSVTDPKLRDSGPLSVIGRSANSTGDPADISGVTNGQILRIQGGTLGFGTIETAGIGADQVTDPKLRDSGPLSVIGRSANSTGDPGDISATAASGAVLRESGSALGFGTIATAGIGANQVTLAKIAQGSARSVIGVTGNATADYADIQAGTDGHVLRRSGTSVAFGTIADAAVPTNTLSLSKLVNASATDTFLARDTAGSGAWEEVTAANARAMLGAPKSVYGTWYGGATALSNSADTTLPLGVEVSNLGVTFSDANDTISPGAHDAIAFSYSVVLEATAAVNCRIRVWIEQDPNTGTFTAIAGTESDGHVHTTGTANLERATLALPDFIMATSASYLYRLRGRFVGAAGGVSTVAASTRFSCSSVGVN